jgi:hypothetical protein
MISRSEIIGLSWRARAVVFWCFLNGEILVFKVGADL